MELNGNKSTVGLIPAETLKTITQEICVPITDHIYSAIYNRKSLKNYSINSLERTKFILRNKTFSLFTFFLFEV